MAKKWCVVPLCKSTSKSTPNKVFLGVPRDEKRRKMWLKAVRRDESKKKLSMKTNLYVCEDHFDLENDMENYMKFKMVGGPLRCKHNIVPHIFDCQPRKFAHSAKPRAYILKKKRMEALREALNCDYYKTNEVKTSRTSGGNGIEVDDTRSTTAEKPDFCKMSIEEEKEGCMDAALNGSDARVNEVYIKVQSEDCFGSIDADDTPEESINVMYLNDPCKSEESVYQICVKTEEKDPLEISDAETTFDAPFKETKAYIKVESEGCFEIINADDTPEKSINQVTQVRWMDLNDSPETSCWIKESNCRAINYVEYHETERIYDQNQPNIKLESKEVESGCEEEELMGENGCTNMDTLYQIDVIKEEEEEHGDELEEGVLKEAVEEEVDEGDMVGKQFKCPHCEFSAPYDFVLHSHIKARAGDESHLQFKCSKCEHRTTTKAQLKKHTLIHGDDDPFVCCLCKFRARNCTIMKYHMLEHDGVKLFRCNKCAYRTRVESSLKNHMLSHSAVKPFKCNKCEYRTAVKLQLNSHIRTHDREKRFKCNLCEYKTANNQLLEIHILRHSERKPYKCKVCDYSAPHPSLLKSHVLLTHTQHKPSKYNLRESRSKND